MNEGTKEAFQTVREMSGQLRDCSRCMGTLIALVVVIVAAVTLDAQALKELLLAGMSLATALVMHGAGSQARGKGIEAPAGTTSTATTTATTTHVDPNATRS
jgi:hypothetical protein